MSETKPVAFSKQNFQKFNNYIMLNKSFFNCISSWQTIKVVMLPKLNIILSAEIYNDIW